MDLSRSFYLQNSGKYFAEVTCDRCGTRPAVQLEADCHGDALALCKKHWSEWFTDELLPEFNKEVIERNCGTGFKMVEVADEEVLKKYKGYGKIYTTEKK